jgi:pimeloyl-ACP methyl ester carboxylesterase
MNKTKILGIALMIVLVTQPVQGNEGKTQRQKTDSQKFTRIDTTFKSQGTICAAWLYLPKGISRPPVVIMAHGFGGERTMRLPAYAEYFVRQGLGCLVFDYRTFGGSEGEPRNYVNPTRHLEDWQAAITFARTLDSVDIKRMALWGTSFSGGHVIVTAANTPGISVIVAQVPFVDGRSSKKSMGYKLHAVYHGFLDAIGAALFNRRHYVPMVGGPDTFAMLNTPDALEGSKKLLPPGVSPGRKCPANIALTSFFYRPIKFAPKVVCPALIIYGEQDTLISPQDVRKTAESMQKATVIGLPVKHFDVYDGETFEKVVSLEAEFLKKQFAHALVGLRKDAGIK